MSACGTQRKRGSIMKKFLIALTFLFSLLLCGTALGKDVDMDFFLIDFCGACHGRVERGCGQCTKIEALTLKYKDMFPDDELNMTFHNLRYDKTAIPNLNSRLEKMGLSYDPAQTQLPIVFIDEEAFLADGTMDEAIKDYIETGKTPGFVDLLKEKKEYEENLETGKVIYIYSSYCEDCREVSDWLKYSLPDGYELIKYDLYSEEGQVAEDYYLKALNIPEDEYVLPLIIYGDYWFSGKDSIYLSLKSRIQEHPRLQTIVYEEAEGNEEPGTEAQGTDEGQGNRTQIGEIEECETETAEIDENKYETEMKESGAAHK